MYERINIYFMSFDANEYGSAFFFLKFRPFSCKISKILSAHRMAEKRKINTQRTHTHSRKMSKTER